MWNKSYKQPYDPKRDNYHGPFVGRKVGHFRCLSNRERKAQQSGPSNASNPEPCIQLECITECIFPSQSFCPTPIDWWVFSFEVTQPAWTGVVGFGEPVNSNFLSKADGTLSSPANDVCQRAPAVLF